MNDGCILMLIRFKFRIDYDAENGGRVLLKRNDVETVCLLSQRKPDTTIEVDLDISELEVSSAETRATYEEIKSCVLKNSG